MKPAWLLLGLCLCSCGQDVSSTASALQLAFSWRDIPAEVDQIKYYVLPEHLRSGATVDCANFVGPGAESVFNYSNDFVENGQEAVSPGENVLITIPELPPESLLFVVEAVSGSSTRFCGCGKGKIEKGKRTTVPIFLIADCP